MQGKSYRLAKAYILSIILLFVIYISYGHSYLVYSSTMIALIIVSFCVFVKNIKKYPKICMFICVYNVVTSFFLGMMNGGLQDALMAGVSLILPLVFASYHIVTDRVGNVCRYIGWALVILNFMKSYIPVLANMNMNSYSFLMFIGFSSVFILAQLKKTPGNLLLLFMVLYVLSGSGSRNAFIIALIITVLELLPYKALTNAVVYRGIYIISLMYQVFSEEWMELAYRNPVLSKLFFDIVEPFFDKHWGLENRVEILVNVSDVIWRQSIWKLLFGNGNAFLHAHNGFYQTMYMYGIVGTVLIFLMYIIIFEMAYKVIKQNENSLVLGCVLALSGMLLIQGADVFLWGVKACVVVPFLLAGVIIRAYMEQNWNEQLKSPKGEINVSK